MAPKVTRAPFHQTAYRPRLWSTRRFGGSMGKNGRGRLPRIGKCAPAFTASLIEDRQVGEGPRHVGMARAERLLTDRQCALEEPLRLFVLALVSIHEGQIVEGPGHVGVVRTERFFQDR
jgi:hypothetical protein